MASKRNKVLKSLRVQHDINQKEMAKLLGIAISSYNQKENGKYDFTQNEIEKIIQIFNKPYEEIFLPGEYA